MTILTGNEAESIMMKNKQLLEANFQLEEQMRALQKNQVQMSEELANRFVLVLHNSSITTFALEKKY